MKRIIIAASAAFAMLVAAFSMTAPASAQGIYQGGSYERGLVPWRGRTSLGPWGVQRPCCGTQQYYRPRTIMRTVTVPRRVIVAREPVLVQRPVYATRYVTRQVPVAPVVAPVVSAPCGDCSVDLVATYIDCVFKDGRQVWRYRTARGIVTMDMQRRNEADQLRFQTDGKIVWVAKG